MSAIIHQSHAAILKAIGKKELSAADIAERIPGSKTGSDVHNLCYRMIRDGLLTRSHNGRGWLYKRIRAIEQRAGGTK